MQESKQTEGKGLKLVSNHFSKPRLAVWAACYGRGVLALRQNPLTGAVQEGKPAARTSKQVGSSAGKQAKSKFEDSF